MAQTVETLLRENIFGIFGEHDTQKRQAKIGALWAENGVFIVPQGRYQGHHGVERAAAEFIAQFPTFTFALRGNVLAFNGVGMVPWAFGPPGKEPAITGVDVLVMKDDKIGAVYGFEDSRKK